MAEIKKLQIADGVIITPPVDISASIASGSITGGSIDNTPIGTTTPSSGAFTTLQVDGVEVVTKTKQQTITNKKLDDNIQYKEIVTPAVPDANYMKLYPKADHKFYSLTNTGIETEIGSGASGGSGSQNFIDDSVAFTTTANVTNVITNVATEKLGEQQTFKINATASALVTDKTSIPFSIPRGYEGRLLKLSFLFEKSTGFADDDFEAVVVHDPAGTPTDVLSQNVKLIKDFPVFETPFFSVNDNTKLNYELQFRVKTPSKAIEFFVGELKVNSKSASANIGDWKTYTEADITLTNVTGNSVLSYAELIPYKDPISQSWRLVFNMGLTSNSATIHVFNISGISINKAQAFSIGYGSTSGFDVSVDAVNNFNCRTAANKTTYYISGDIALASKPPWADYDNTIKLLDDNTLYENAEFKLKHTSNQALAATSIVVLRPQLTLKKSGFTYNQANGEITVKNSGKYLANCSSILSTSLTTQINGLYIIDNLSNYILANDGLTGRFYTLNGEVYLEKGKVYKIEFVNNTSTPSAILANDRRNIFSFTRLPEKNVGAPIGVMEAGNGNFGLVQVEELSPVIISKASLGTNGKFTISGYRVGKMVTLLIKLQSGAGTTIEDISSGAILPVSFRPKETFWNEKNIIQFRDPSTNKRKTYIINISTVGGITFFHKDIATNLSVAWPSTSPISTMVTYFTN